VSKRGVRRFVRDLLEQRRPHRFQADADDAAELQAAIALRAAGPDSGPSDSFVDSLQQRLRSELDEQVPVEAPPPAGRRRFVASVAAASVVSVGLGVAADQTILRPRDRGTGETAGGDRTVVPDSGEWRAVVAAKDLPDGGVRPFDLGTINGFVHRTDGQLRAVSGVCTHLGCKLALDPPKRQLNCPCHNAAFGVDGAVLHHRLPIALQPLPQLVVRESEGVVQVFVPSRPA
jgi:nitrite reductase/ring-hydroxylating ferredoxin subunit